MQGENGSIYEDWGDGNERLQLPLGECAWRLDVAEIISKESTGEQWLKLGGEVASGEYDGKNFDIIMGFDTPQKRGMIGGALKKLGAEVPKKADISNIVTLFGGYAGECIKLVTSSGKKGGVWTNIAGLWNGSPSGNSGASSGECPF